ncbi:RAMP superfamily CRISPR-associated protein [Saccharopolyspora griseoalba]|uniref:RAMP superfamily CRISPR-associated protein n=1 Tax=Saccharopolyspora griseoalba TaxID=1431848 RepID=A0ABW2LLC9_9PSEU
MTALSTLEFSITFHSPFRVSTGHAAPGLDTGVDGANPLPASSLKGVMRATASQLLGEVRLVDEVFGSPEQESPWLWRDAVGNWDQPKPATRVSLDAETHAAAKDMLVVQEQIGTDSARFTITQRHRLDEQDFAKHRLVLAVAGQATRSLGGNRRRGLGWVTITSESPKLDDSSAAAFLELA